jgi:hypothetical protein
MSLRKADKKAIIASTTNLKANPTNVKLLPFDDRSKEKIKLKQI